MSFGCCLAQNPTKDSKKSLAKDGELRKKVRAAVDANIPFEKAENFVGVKAMFPATDSSMFWVNRHSSFRVTAGDFAEGDLPYDYKYLLNWLCAETGKGGVAIVVGIFWDRNLKPFYYEGWIYPH